MGQTLGRQWEDIGQTCSRLSGFLIQDKNLTECIVKEKKKKNKAHIKITPEFAVKNNKLQPNTTCF